MPSRLDRPVRHARRACAALGVGALLLTGAARAQQADGLGLRGAETPEAPAAALGAAAAAGEAPPGEAPSDEAQKKPSAAPSKSGLPRLQLYKGAQRLGQRGGPQAPASGQTPAPAVAALPTPPAPKHKPPDDRSFDPTGIGLGDFTLKPYVEEDLGWSSNPELLPGPQKSSAFLMSQAGFALDSNWTSNALHADARGGLTDYFANPAADTPSGSGDVNGRLDVSRDLALDANGRFAVTTMTAGSLGLGPNVGFGPSGPPLTATYGAAMGGDQKFGLLDFSLHGSIDRTSYESTTLSNGTVDDLASDNFNDWGLRGRAGWRMSEAFRPFLDLLVDTRRYDSREDQYGYERSSNGVAARVGADIDIAPTLVGSLDLGYGERNYQDPRLPNVDSPLFDASLTWTATPLTTVIFKSATTLAETTIPRASGDVQHLTSLEVDHALRRWLTLSGTASYATDSYVGLPWRDSTTTFGLALSCSLNRDVVLKASASRQYYQSNQPGTNYNATIVSMGVRLQH